MEGQEGQQQQQQQQPQPQPRPPTPPTPLIIDAGQMRVLVQGLVSGMRPDPEARFRPRDPDLFEGDKSKYRSWKNQMERYMAALASVSESKQITILMSNIRGPKVDDWVTAYAEENFDPAAKAWTVGVVDAWQALDLAFSDRAADRTALARLQRLRQGNRPAVEFFQEFEALVRLAGYTTNDKWALEWVRAGIHPQHLDSVYKNPIPPVTYAEWKAVIIQLDDAWAQRLAINAPIGNFNVAARQPQAPQIQQRAPTFRPPAVNVPNVPVPAAPPAQMRRDGTGVTFGGRGQPMDIDRCWTCGKGRAEAGACNRRWHGQAPWQANVQRAPPAQQPAQRTRAMWEEDEFQELVRRWAAEDPDGFQAAGFGFGSA